jgi:hypothetical protein
MSILCINSVFQCLSKYLKVYEYIFNVFIVYFNVFQCTCIAFMVLFNVFIIYFNEYQCI